MQGHRAQTYDHDYSDEMSDAFFEYWIMERDPAWHAWRDAQFDWIYNGGAKSGLIPATMAPDGRYAFEMYLSADGSDAPDGDDDNYLIWAEIGDPEYPPEL